MTDLPNNTEVEACLLGAVLRNDVAYAKIDRLAAEDFFAPEHRAIWEQVSGRFDRGDIPNPATLAAWADSEPMLTHVKGSKYLYELMANVISVVNVNSYARQIRDLADRRGIMAACDAAKARAADLEDFDDTAAEIAAALTHDVSTTAPSSAIERAGSVAMRVLDALGEDLPCTSTGMPKIDEALGGGLYAGKLYGIGGRMKGGKTMLKSTIAYNIAAQNVPIAFLTLEDDSEGVLKRLMARQMNVNMVAFSDPDVRQKKWFVEKAQKAAVYFRDRPIEMLTKPSMRFDELRSTVARIGMKGEAKGIFIDYWQIIGGKPSKQTLVDHLNDVAQWMADAAKRYGVWIVCGAQMNRDGEFRYGDGLFAACDAAFVVHQIETEYKHETVGMWLEMKAGRYTPMRDIGGEEVAAFWIDKKSGPHIREYGDDIEWNAA